MWKWHNLSAWKFICIFSAFSFLRSRWFLGICKFESIFFCFLPKTFEHFMVFVSRQHKSAPATQYMSGRDQKREVILLGECQHCERFMAAHWSEIGEFSSPGAPHFTVRGCVPGLEWYRSTTAESAWAKLASSALPFYRSTSVLISQTDGETAVLGLLPSSCTLQ